VSETGRGRTSNPPGLDAEPTRRTHNADGTRARGASNGNDRGNVTQRQRRKTWLLTTYAADVKLTRYEWGDGEVTYEPPKAEFAMAIFAGTAVSAVEVETCRCYRCGTLLWAGTLTVDRIVPGCHGGTYARTNIRPACGKCNSETGATTRRR
jgi:5-methylcytosine-specific restriction endonuclease McrA